jgi:hypothetical protein
MWHYLFHCILFVHELYLKSCYEIITMKYNNISYYYDINHDVIYFLGI